MDGRSGAAVAADCATIAPGLPAFALGVLDPEEQRETERHLNRCPDCRIELRRQEDALAALLGATEPVAPPPGLRDRLLVEIAQDRDRAPGTAPPWSSPATWRARRPIALPWPVAAGLALVATLLVAALIGGGVLLDQARDERDAAVAAQRTLAQYLRLGGAVTPLVAASGGTDSGVAAGQGSLVVAPGQADALVVVTGLTPSEDAGHYRVWVARGDDRTGVGELTVRADGCGYLIVEPPEPLDGYDRLGITLVAGVVGDPETPRTDLLLAPVLESSAGPD